MGWLRKKYEKAKVEVKGELKHRAQVKKAQKESYRAAQLKEAKSFGQRKAKYESEQKIKALKEQKPAYNFGGFAGPTKKQPSPSIGVADYLLGGSPGSSKRGKKKDRGISQELRGLGL